MATTPGNFRPPVENEFDDVPCMNGCLPGSSSTGSSQRWRRVADRYYEGVPSTARNETGRYAGPSSYFSTSADQTLLYQGYDRSGQRDATFQQVAPGAGNFIYIPAEPAMPWWKRYQYWLMLAGCAIVALPFAITALLYVFGGDDSVVAQPAAPAAFAVPTHAAMMALPTTTTTTAAHLVIVSPCCGGVPEAAPQPCCGIPAPAIPVVVTATLTVTGMQSKTTTTKTTLATTSTSTTTVHMGICYIYGDPHITTFDKWHETLYVEGEFWMVKSDTVTIQARYKGIPGTDGLSMTKELIIGGPFLNDRQGKPHTILVTANETRFDGSQILADLGDTYHNDNFALGEVSANFDRDGIRLQRGLDKFPMQVVHLQLPFDVKVVVNKWELPTAGSWINAQIEMPQLAKQDGQCGDFNGDPADDKRTAVQARGAWSVEGDDEARLFAGTPWKHGFRGKYKHTLDMLSECFKEAVETYCEKELPEPPEGTPMEAVMEKQWARNDCQHEYAFHKDTFEGSEACVNP